MNKAVIAVIVVDYNSNHYTESLINSFRSQENFDKFEINVAFTGRDIVHNNEYFQSHVMDNVGYFGAVRNVLNALNVSDYKSFIICNNDIEVLSDDLYKLILSCYRKCDVLAPDISDMFNKSQNPHRRHKPSRFSLLKYRIYFAQFHLGRLIYYFRSRSKDGGYSPKASNEQIGNSYIYSPHGAFLILMASFFEKGGYIDAGFFLYGEEDSIGAICSKRNMQVLYDPRIKIKHYASVSTGKGFSKWKWLEQKKAHQYIRRKYTDFRLFQ